MDINTMIKRVEELEEQARKLHIEVLSYALVEEIKRSELEQEMKAEEEGVAKMRKPYVRDFETPLGRIKTR